MSEKLPHIVQANFRQDPLLVALLRRAIAAVGVNLPDFDEAAMLELAAQYRQAKGERGFDIKFSPAKQELDAHRAAYRGQYVSVLASCLYSQFDRMQGREAAWSYLDNNSTGLVSDRVMERRLVIDELTRLIDYEADEGVKVFDALLCQSLGRQSTSIRENPMRPAVYFHALGLCWTRASGKDDHELFVLRRHGPAIAKRISNVFPQLTAMLRERLGVPRPSGNILLMRQATPGQSLYARKSQPVTITAGGDEARRHADDPTSGSGESSPNAAARSTAEWDSRLVVLDRMFEAGLAAASAPPLHLLLIARMQLAAARCALRDPAFFDDVQHPLRRLLADVFDPSGWRRLNGAKAFEDAAGHLELTLAVLRRDGSDIAANRRLYDHLRSQLLALRSSQPAVGIDDDDDVHADAPSEKKFG